MSASLSLTKHHGLGNDFLVALQSRSGDYVTDEAEREQIARSLCDRHRGIGADGFIFGDAGEAPIDLRMALYNSDGSRAEISGNGIRCLAQAWAVESATRKGKVSIATDGGLRSLEVAQLDDRDAVVRVEMGTVQIGETSGDGPNIAEEIAQEFGASSATLATVGNPHVVLWFDSIEGLDPAEIGPLVEAKFPDGINVHLAHYDSESAISLTHWERGVGITEACGSGATASAAIANHEYGAATEITVSMPGGEATVEIGEPSVLVGPSVLIASIEVPR